MAYGSMFFLRLPLLPIRKTVPTLRGRKEANGDADSRSLFITFYVNCETFPFPGRLRVIQFGSRQRPQANLMSLPRLGKCVFLRKIIGYRILDIRYFDCFKSNFEEFSRVVQPKAADPPSPISSAAKTKRYFPDYLTEAISEQRVHKFPSVRKTIKNYFLPRKLEKFFPFVLALLLQLAVEAGMQNFNEFWAGKFSPSPKFNFSLSARTRINVRSRRQHQMVFMCR